MPAQNPIHAHAARSPSVRWYRTMALASVVAVAVPLVAQSGVDPRGRAILFVRGAYGTGGATEGGTPAQRTEQLSDVLDTGTAPGNHGYGTLRAALVADGFRVDQLVESSTAITTAALLPYRVVVFGSNNRTYAASEVQAFHAYVDAGGSALFISDANWGPTWEAAPASDNQFLARYGAQVYQDSGFLPTMARTTSGRYLVPDHAALSGPDGVGGTADVSAYNGEGVSLFRITGGADGFQAVRIVSADGLSVRLNDPSGQAGATRPAGSGDAAMVAARKGASRILGHFDRNTFFNAGGAGTDIQKLDNQRLALNLFRFLAAVPASAVPVGAGCGRTSTPSLSTDRPILGRSFRMVLAGASAGAPGLLALAEGSPRPVRFGPSCTTFVDLAGMQVAAYLTTGAAGDWSLATRLPELHTLAGLRVTAQVLTLVGGGPFAGGGELSNGSDLVAGFPE